MGLNVGVVHSAAQFPQQTEVVVIGGGIIGVATALSLVSRGIPTVLVEKGYIAGEQSSRNWGWCRRTGRDIRELPLINLSMQLWEGMNERLQQDCGFKVTGIAYASRSEQQLQTHQQWLQEARQHDIHSEMLSREQLQAKMPGLKGNYFGALYTPGDGRAEPQRAAPALATAACEAGLNLQQHCAVRQIGYSGGKVSEVITERGVIRCSSVVVAGGAWSRLLMQGCGLTLPQLKVLSMVLRTSVTDFNPGMSASFGSVAIRKRQDGGLTVASSATSISDITPDSLRFMRSYLPAYRQERQSINLRFGGRFWHEMMQWQPGKADQISLYEKIRVLDPQPDAAAVARILANLHQTLPQLSSLQAEQSWAGYIDTLPDAIPVISGIESVPGLFLATGFSGHGFGIGPGAGQLMADLVSGSTPSVDPRPFRFSRFTDGEKIQAQHWL